MFNYIVNVHNSEKHLNYVLEGVLKCKGLFSKVYVVLDGCTDDSEVVAKKYPVTILKTPDIRETLAINYALDYLKNTGAKYNIILQDDVVIIDTDIEQKLINLYAKYPNTGVIGFRHGTNLDPECLTNGKIIPDTDIIQNQNNSQVGDYPMLGDGEMAYRHIVYKSPICIPKAVYDVLGGYDERFAPIYHEDAEYGIRAWQAGFKNIVLGLRIYQPREWSGCARFEGKMRALDPIQAEHMELLRKLYPEQIKQMILDVPSKEIIQLW